jgi:peptidoglycan/LPS O-acetylase OafA/YrhL
MGIRNSTVRKLAVPDLTTTVLTMTLTGLAADSPPAGSPAVRPLRRVAAVVAMLLGALVGASLIDHALALPLAAAALLSLLALVPLIPRQASS